MPRQLQAGALRAGMMTIFFFILGMAQCVLVWILGKSGGRLAQSARMEWEQAASAPRGGWPSCALIVPVAGTNPAIEEALVSLASQNYPRYALCMVTGSEGDPAAALVRQIATRYPHALHIHAGLSGHSGQKNHNLLAGLASGASQAQVYAFADSTHIARPDFLRCLIRPIASGEAAFTTGYHEVLPAATSLPVLGYAISVLFMHFMQGIPSLTQPWGGAMAMSREAFERYDVEALWRDNVVDDCSLASLLEKRGAHARLCPGAILATKVAHEPVAVWRAWMERQILFLKFCMPGQWILLGLASILMTAPAVWCVCACAAGILGRGGGMSPFLALCWLCCIGWAVSDWRRYISIIPDISRWIMAFFCACFMFLLVYMCTIGKKTLLWHGYLYHVGKGGRVKGIERH